MSELGRITVNNSDIIEVSTDPSTGSGVPADIGSIAIDTNTGIIYNKTTAPDTGWEHYPRWVPGLNIGFSTNDRHASSMLELRANNRGILIPRMTAAERAAISSPADGLMVYDTTYNTLAIFDSSAGIWRYSFTRDASLTASNTTTGWVNSGFSIPSLEAGRYSIIFFIRYASAATTTGAGFRLSNGTATFSAINIAWQIANANNSTAGLHVYFQQSVTDNFVAANSPFTAAANIATGHGVVTISSAGAPVLEFRSEITNSAITLAYAYVNVTRIG